MTPDDGHPSPIAQLQAPTIPAPPAPDHRRRGPRPVPPGVPYHRVLAGEERRIGRGVLAILLLVGGLLAFSVVAGLLVGGIDQLFGRTNPAMGGTEYTPLYHAGTLAAIALVLPWSMLIQRWLYGVRGASLHSVLSTFRFDLFARTLLVVGALWAVEMYVFSILMPMSTTTWRLNDLYGVLLVTLLLTPLQSAGEEYGLRGLVFRIAGSWARGPRTALVTGVLVSALVFTVIHLATDPWLNLYYFTFGVTLALVTWRTGGLEIAVVVHAVNNTLAMVFVLVARGDLLTGLTDRSVGVGTAAMLLPCAFLVATTAVVWWRTRRTGPALTPGSPRHDDRPAA